MLMRFYLSDERKEIEKLLIQNGGKYSPELTKKCTHLICDISYMLFLVRKVLFGSHAHILSDLTLDVHLCQVCKALLHPFWCSTTICLHSPERPLVDKRLNCSELAKYQEMFHVS